MFAYSKDIKEARMVLGLTQRELAKKASVSFMTVFRVEQGDDITPTSLQRIMQALKERAREKDGDLH